ncbi:MAG: hypothetical protein QXD62_00185 [Candidatus Woesearchaeota archaeon]
MPEIDPKLLNYIKNCISLGYSKEQIKASLISVGWDEKTIENAFSFLENKETVSKEINPIIFETQNSKIKLHFLILIFGIFVMSTLFGIIYFTVNRGRDIGLSTKSVSDELNIKLEFGTRIQKNNGINSNSEGIILTKEREELILKELERNTRAGKSFNELEYYTSKLK